MKRVKSKILLIICAAVLCVAAAVGISFIGRSSEAEASTYSVSSFSNLSSYVSSYKKTSSSSQNTIKLTANLTADSTITLDEGYYITIDLNGYNIALSSSTSRLFYVYGTLTIKDSSASFSKSSSSSKGSDSLKSSSNKYTATYYASETNGKYSKITYTAGSIYGGSSTSSSYSPIYVAAGGTFNLYGGIFHSGSYNYGGAVQLRGTDSTTTTFNMYGGLMYGNTVSNYGGAVYGYHGNINMYGGGMVNNTSSASGGAIYSTCTSSINFGYVNGTSSAQDFDRAYLVGNTANIGGAVFENSDPYFYYYDGVVVSDNSATTSGGAVYANGIGYIYGGDFVRNTAPDGTYYRASTKTLIIDGGNFYYNSVTSGGGVVYAVSSSTVNISGGDFENNSAKSGGVVYLAATSKLNISDGTFKGNTASSYGGVVYVDANGTITVTGGTFSGNSSSSYAGVIYMNGGTAKISGADFSGNSAVRGGVTYTKSGDYDAVVKISDSTFTGNTASSYGGVFYPTGSSKLYLTNVSVTGSSSKYGAVLYSNNASSYTSFDNVEITDNTSTSKYGAIYVFGETHLSGKVVIKGNTYNGAENNMHIYSDHYLTLDGPLSQGSYVGLSMASSTQTQITYAETSTSYYSQSACYFHMDSVTNLYPSAKKQNYIALTDSDDATVVSVYTDSTTGYHDSLSDAFAAASGYSGETKMTLLDNTYEDSTITLAEGCVVALDLAGHNVTWTGAAQSNFFYIDGDFTLDDSLATGGTAAETLGCGVTAVDVSNGTTGFSNTLYRTVYGVMDGNGTTSYYVYRSGAIMGGAATGGTSGSGTNSRGGAFYVSSTGSMTMYGGTIYGNTGTYSGGVHSYGTFTMYGGSISENVSQNSSTNHNGAGLLNDGGSVYLYGGVFYGNTASGSGYGGAIENLGTLTMDILGGNTYDKAGIGPVISGNFANKYGGGIYGTGTLYIYGGYVTLNTSSSYGGGIYSTGETVVSGAFVTGNTGYYGGGIYVTGALTVSGSYIVGNEATSNYAGGIYASGAAEVTGTLFALNTTVKYGGAMYSSGTLTVTDCIFKGNTMTSSSGYGGGLYAAASAVISGTTFEGNVSAGYGGALCLVGAVTSELTGVKFENNSAAYGGALYVGSSGPTVTMTEVTMTGNSADMYGGAIYTYNSASRIELLSGEITGNSAGTLGGAVYLNAKATLALYGGKICGNTAGTYGGGVYSISSYPVIVGGGSVVGCNTQGTEKIASNIYLASGSLVTVEADFTGRVSFLTEEAPNVVIGGDAMDVKVFREISGKLSADDESVECIGLNSDGYLSLFLSHSVQMFFDETDTGYTAVKCCVQCYASDTESADFSVTYETGEDGNLVMVMTDNETGETVSQTLEGGALVTDASGEKTWYSDLDSAVKAVSEGGSMVLNQDAENLTFELSGSITVDLNGHTVGNVTVSGSEGTTLTIEDSSMGAGTVTGELSATEPASIAVKGGTYYEADVSGLLATGDGGEAYYILSTTDENGDAVSRVYSESEMRYYAAVYVETGEDDAVTRIYYESVGGARAANTGDYTITLIRDVEEDSKIEVEENQSVKIDLAGHTLTADINITAGDGTETGKLTVTDTLGTGSLAGTIKVSGVSEDTSASEGESTNSYSETLFVATTAVSADLVVDLTELYSEAAESHVEYYFSLVTETDGSTSYTSYQITTGHVCSYIFPELFIGSDGSLKAYLRCSCGEAAKDADGETDIVFDVGSQYVTVTEDDATHTVTYSVSGWSPDSTAYPDVQDATLSFEYVVKINTYNGSGELTGTIYLDEDHLENLDDILEANTDSETGAYAVVEIGSAVASITDGEGKTTYYTSLQAALDAASSGDTVTLLSDVTEDVEISKDGVTLDLNGHGVDGDVTATSGSLTIEDTSSDGTGSVSGDVSGDITVTGGSYSFNVDEYLSEGYAIYVTAGDDGGLVYTVIDAEEGVSEGATVVASVTYKVDDKEVTVYYESLSDAVENLPDGAVLTLLADSTDETLDITISESVTIDLNGCSLAANITAEGGASLTIEDGSTDGTGSLNGKISGDGDVTVTGGTYSQTIADYVKEGCSVYVTHDDDGNMIYEVLTSADIEDADFSPAASVEYTRGDGTTITIYYSSIADAVANVSDGDVITVLTDITSEDLVFATMSDTAVNVTLDLNGCTIDGGVEAGYNVNLTITDGSEEKAGSVTGSLTETGSGTITVEGGTYSEDVSSHIDAKKSDVVLVVDYDEESESYTYTVVSETELSASVQVTYTDEDGNKKTIYFESIDDAVAYVCDANFASDGTGVTITLLDNAVVESADGLVITSGNVTIDLNGNKLTGSISVSEEASDGTTLTVTGVGTTTSDVSKYVDEGYAVIENTDGTYSVVKESDALASAAAVVVDADGVKTYYASADAAISSLSDGDKFTLLSEATLSSDAAISANVTIDLNGNTLTGDLTVTGSAEITDGVGGGKLDGNVTASSGNLTITGGTFTDTSLKSCVAEGYVVVENNDGSFTVIDKDSVASVAEAYYVDGNGNITYYSSVEEALACAGKNGGKVVLCSDASAGAIDIYTGVEIDLAGFTLDAEIIIHADENAEYGGACGTLTVSNTTTDDENGSVGSLTGTITVVGTKDYTNTDETNNPYADTLLIKDGVTPGADLWVDVYTSLGTDVAYTFGENSSESGDVTYGIGRNHLPNYNIENWTFNADGTATLYFSCACGDYDLDGDGNLIIYDAEVEITYLGNGIYSFTATVEIGGETYEAYTEKSIVALVTDAAGNTYYAESLQEAADIAATLVGSTVTVLQDTDEEVSFRGEVTIDLGDSSVGGISAEDGSYVVITGDGYVGTLTSEGDAVLKVRGGTYDGSCLDELMSSTDFYNGYAVYVNEDGTLSVVDEDVARINAAASVTDSDGNVIYYETMEAALEALEDGDTLTLWNPVDEDTVIDIAAEGVTLDLNGYDVYGTVLVEGGASAVIVGEGFVDYVKTAGDGELVIRGGTYDSESYAEGFVDTDYCDIIVNGDGTYTVVGKGEAEDAASAVVHFTDGDAEYDIYFENLQEAADYAVSVGGSLTLISDCSGGLYIDGDLDIDLNGCIVDGGLTVTDGAAVTVRDGVGGGAVTGALSVSGDSTLAVYGGTYSDVSVEDYLPTGEDETYVAVENSDGTYTVMTEDEALESCGAYGVFVDEDGNEYTRYFSSGEDAIYAAVTEGGSVTLQSDADLSELVIDLGELVITTHVEIDLNGYTLRGDITILTSDEEDASVRGELWITDSSNGSGALEGNITVKGAGDTGSEDDPYEDTLVLDGIAINDKLTLDLSDIQPDGSATDSFVLSVAEDETYRISDKHDHVYDIPVWTFGEDGSVTLRFMCVCGEFETDADGNEISYTADASEVTVIDNGDGTVTVEAAIYVDGVEYACSQTENVAAYVDDEDGNRTYFADMENALAYVLENGGTITLNEDVSDADITVPEGTDVTINLNGHTLEGSLSAEDGASLTIVGEGTVEAALDVDGVLEIIGVDFTLTEDFAGSGEIHVEDSVVDLGGNTLSGVTGISGDVTFTGSEGSQLLLSGDIENDGTIYIDGDVVIDLCGSVLSSDIEVGSGAALTVVDSSGSSRAEISGGLIVDAGGSLTLCDDTYFGEKLNLGYSEGYVIQSATDASGAAYYELVTEEDHLARGHGFDTLISGVFDAWDLSLTLTYECACGETITRTVYLSADEYTAEVVDGQIVVTYAKSGVVTAPNDSVYSFDVSGTVVLDDMFVEGEDGCGFVYEEVVSANCNNTGVDRYTYGEGGGVVVEVESPVTHRGLVAKHDDETGVDYYLCKICGKYVTDEHSTALYETADQLIEDLGFATGFESKKEEELARLEEMYESILDELDESMPGYDGILAALDELYGELREAVENMDYEAQTSSTFEEREAYYQELFDEIEQMVDDAVTEMQMRSEIEQVRAVLSDLYDSMEEEGVYVSDDMFALRTAIDTILSELDSMTIDDYKELDAGYLVETCVSAAYSEADGVRRFVVDMTEDSGTSGSVTSSGGMSGTTKLVITELDEVYYVVTDDSVLIYMNEGSYSDEELRAMVDGKNIAAAYDIALYDTALSSVVYVFNGQYTVRIALTDELAALDGLQIVYVGDNGKVEIYATTVTDGCIEFTTTHFSTYLLLADIAEPLVATSCDTVTDLTNIIRIVFWVDIGLIALAIVLLIALLSRSNRGRKQSGKVASVGVFALLLAVVPAGGVASLVILGVIGVGCLAADITFICLLSSNRDDRAD